MAAYVEGSSGMWDPAEWNWNPVRMRAEPVTGSPAESSLVDGKASSNHGLPKVSRGKTSRRSVRENLCQADDCKKPLLHLSFYHQRNRICEVHIKALDYRRDGELVRFCQRCGVAHPLCDFDGERKSCRRQLEKHNARRRKREGATPKEASTQNVESELTSGKVTTTRRTSSPVSEGSSQACGCSSSSRGKKGSASQCTGEGTALHSSSRAALGQPKEEQYEQEEDDGSFQHNDNNNQSHVSRSSSNELVDQLSSWITECLDDEGIRMQAAVQEQDVDGGLVLDSTMPWYELYESDQDISGDALAAALMATPSCGESGVSEFTATGPTYDDSISKNTHDDQLLILPCASIKLFGATPADLPPDLPARLRGWCAEEPDRLISEEAYLRPGCLHLTLQACVEARHARPATEVLDKLVGCVSDWWEGSALVQVAAALVLLHGGMPIQRWTVRGPARHRLVPSVHSVWPRIISPGREQQSTVLRVRGINLLQDAAETLVRLQGRFLSVSNVTCGDCRCRRKNALNGAETPDGDYEARCCGCCVARLASVPEEAMKGCCGEGDRVKTVGCCGNKQPDGDGAKLPEARLSPSPGHQEAVLSIASEELVHPGAMHISAQLGPYISPALQVLVVDSPDVAQELNRWINTVEKPIAEEILRAFGIVYEYVGGRDKVRQTAAMERTASRLLYWALRHALLSLARAMLDVLAGLVESVAAASLACGTSTRGDTQPHQQTDGLSLLHAVPVATMAATLRRAMALGGPCEGFTLVHAAIRSRSPDVLREILGWEGVVRQAIEGRKMGVSRVSVDQMLAALAREETPRALEMAKVLNNAGIAINRAALDIRQKTNLKGDDAGSTPTQKGPTSIDLDDTQLLVDLAPGTPKRCCCVGSCPCARRLAGSCCSGGAHGCGEGTGACPCCDPGSSNPPEKEPPRRCCGT